MAEIQAEISYWLSVAIRAIQTFPAFIGNNWVGMLLSFALLLPSIGPRIKAHFINIRTLAWSGKFFYTGRALMSTNWRSVVGVVGVFFFANFLTVGFHDYSGAAQQNMQTINKVNSLKYQLGTTAVDCQLQTGGIRTERDTEKAKNLVLEKQNRDEQLTINNCLVQLGKGQEPLHITQLPLGFMATALDVRDVKHAVSWLLLTNKTVTPVRLYIGCTFPIESVSGGIMSASGGTTAMVGPNDSDLRVSDHEFNYRIISPAWAVDSPLVLAIMPVDQFSGRIGCTIRQE